jgi:hypothetical protein
VRTTTPETYKRRLSFPGHKSREYVPLQFARKLERENAALQKLIIKAGYIITNFDGEMALCRDPWHQPKEDKP